MPRTWWGKAIFWLLLLTVIPAIWRVLSGQTERMKESRIVNDSYHNCMNLAEKEYADSILSRDAKKLSAFSEKYGVENIFENNAWSNVVYYADGYCSYLSRKK